MFGVFFTACGLSLYCLPCDAVDLDFVGNMEQDKQRLMFRLLEASDICGSFMLENYLYATQVLGDAHYSIGRKLGDLSTAVFAHGLHEHRGAVDEPF